MDPVTIIGGATVAFNALKKGFQVGKDLQDMSGQLTQWASAMSDLSYAEQKNKNPPWWKALNGQSVEAEALEIFTAKKKAESMRKELKDWISFSNLALSVSDNKNVCFRIYFSAGVSVLHYLVK